MVHAGEELLFARLRQDITEVGDELDNNLPGSQTHTPATNNTTYKRYQASYGTWRRRAYERRAGFEWVSYTDFRGLTVPLEVIQEMRRTEGDGSDWERRGVEVGNAAWQVLLDWHAEAVAARV